MTIDLIRGGLIKCIGLQSLFGVYCLVVASHSLALDADLAISLGSEYSDNVLKTNDATAAEWENVFGASVGMNHQGKDVLVDVQYQGEYTRYASGIDNYSAIEGDANFVYGRETGVSQWRLKNSRRSVVRDKSLVDIGSNREDRSITQAGVDIMLRPAAANEVITSLYYNDIVYQDSDQLNSSGPGGSLTWSRRLTPIDSLFVRGDYQENNFDNTLFDYDYYSGVVGYTAALVRLNYTVSAGYNEQKRNGQSYSGTSYNLNAKYNSQGAIWNLSLSKQLTDSSRGNNNNVLSDIDFSENIGAVNQFYELLSIQLQYSNQFLCPACTLVLVGRSVDESYEDAPNDNRQLTLLARMVYKYTPTTDFSGQIYLNDLQFYGDNPRGDYTVYRYRLTSSHKFSADFRGSVFIQYEERDADNPGENYNEMRAGLNLSYEFF